MKSRLIAGALAGLAAVLAGALTGCGGASTEHRPLTVAWVVDPCWAQVPVAQDLGFFDDTGREIKVVPFPTGAAALEALAGGAVDVANGGDVPTSAAALKNPNLRIIADGSRWDGGRFVARKSAGINVFDDLRGRKIGVPLGGAAHYFATKFLAERDIQPELINIGPAEIVTAVANGDVDVVAVFQPVLTKAVHALGDDAIELQGEEKYNQHSLYLTNADTMANRSADLSALVGAIRRADEPLTNKNPAALAAVAKATGLDEQLFAEVADEFDYATHLGPDLALDLADRARWAQHIGRIPRDAQIPEYSTIISDEALEGTGR